MIGSGTATLGVIHHVGFCNCTIKYQQRNNVPWRIALSLTPELKAKLLKIRQDTSTWQCTVRRAPLWVTKKREPAYRPFVMMVINPDTDKIRKIEITRERPDVKTVLGHLFKIMQGSIFPPTPKGRPTRISIDDAALAQACAPQLAEIGIRCDYRPSMPEINETLWEMEAHMNKREPIAGLHKLPGVSLPLATELYNAAAEYYQKAPWRWIANRAPIEIRYPADGPARYALVLGQSGEFYGLSLYTSISDVAAILSRRDTTKPLDPPVTWVSLIFSEPALMPFEDLDAIEQYGFPVAGETAYPLVIKPTNDDFGNSPSAADVAWVAAALRTLPVFISEHIQADRGMMRESQASLPLTNVHGGQQIALRFPAVDEKGHNPLDRLVDPDLEAFIADWGWDQKTAQFAWELGQFMFDFLDSLDNLSEQTISKHKKNCWYIGWLACHHAKDKNFSPKMFLGAPRFEKEFKRKVSNSEAALKSYQTTWRKLEKYARGQA